MLIFFKCDQKMKILERVPLFIFVKNYQKLKIFYRVPPIDFCQNHQKWRFCVEYPCWFLSKIIKKWKFCIGYPYWFLSKIIKRSEIFGPGPRSCSGAAVKIPALWAEFFFAVCFWNSACCSVCLISSNFIITISFSYIRLS